MPFPLPGMLSGRGRAPGMLPGDGGFVMLSPGFMFCHFESAT